MSFVQSAPEKNKTLVSVIIPAWNRAPFIGRCIRSVAEQDCIDRSGIEIIVIDDGSTDGTPEAAEAVGVGDAVLRVIRSSHCGQPGTTRNKGLAVACGDFVAFCDSDDYWLPHHLATAFQEFKQEPSLGMVSNFWGLAQFTVTPNGIKTDIVVPHHPPSAVNTNCRVHRMECYKKVGDFNTSRWGEDLDYFTRIEKVFNCTKTGIVTSVNGYIRGGNNLTYESDAGVKGRYF